MTGGMQGLPSTSAFASQLLVIEIKISNACCRICAAREVGHCLRAVKDPISRLDLLHKKVQKDAPHLNVHERSTI